jgi:hypothetical protein
LEGAKAHANIGLDIVGIGVEFVVPIPSSMGHYLKFLMMTSNDQSLVIPSLKS